MSYGKNTLLCSALLMSIFYQAHAKNTISPNDFDLKGHITFASEYSWRGISLSSNQPTIQGGLNLNHNSGLFAGIWASNTKLAGNDASIEADYYIGYHLPLTEQTNLKFQYMDINYPTQGAGINANFEEYSIGINTGHLIHQHDQFSSSIAFSPSYYANSGHLWRFDAKYLYPISSNINILSALGMSKLEDKSAFTKVWGGSGDKDHYWNWQLGLSSTFLGLYSELYYSDNSDINPDAKAMDSSIVFSITKAF